RASEQPRSREPPRGSRAGLAETEDASRRGGRRRRAAGLSRSTMKKIVAALFVVLLIAAGGGAYMLRQRLETPFRGYPGDAGLVTIASGAGTRTIGDRLVEAGVVSDTLVYRVALWMTGDARRLKAGEYRFDKPMLARDVIGKIARGEVDQVAITFPEGLTIREM